MSAAPFRTISASLAVVVLVLATAACGSTLKAPKSLGTVCQVKACVCRSPNPSLFTKADEVPIEWSVSGEASCPSGYVLQEQKKR